MFNTLYSKLVAVLFVLVCLIGLLFFSLVRYSTEMYQHEVTQKLNVDLAKHIVADATLLKDKKVNFSALKDVFHMLMVINPSIEVYLLDKTGNILAYSAPEGKVKRKRVDLKPLQRFIESPDAFPIMGQDPRDPVGHKVFSVAAIPEHGAIAGYLYVILGGEQYDSIADMLRESYILRLSMWGLAAGLLASFLAGLFLFALLTRRLKGLSHAMSSYAQGKNADAKVRYETPEQEGDEIDRLGASFNNMADRIDKQLHELKQNDAKRRELIANISHDLRTPLASLHGYLETLLLKEDTLSIEERKRYLQIATSHSDRLGQLITDLFELAKLDSCETVLSIESFSLGELVQDVVQKFKLSASEKQIDLVADFGEDIPFAYGDIGMMQRVLDNLIDNALRYTPAGGRITISLSADKGRIVVKVADTGCGIPKEEVTHIFDRFYRLSKDRKDEGQNSGLGLAIAKRILELHGSKITAQSKVDQGTTFSFDITAYQS